MRLVFGITLAQKVVLAVRALPSRVQPVAPHLPTAKYTMARQPTSLLLQPLRAPLALLRVPKLLPCPTLENLNPHRMRLGFGITLALPVVLEEAVQRPHVPSVAKRLNTTRLTINKPKANANHVIKYL